MFPKYLIGFLGVTTVVGGAAVTSIYLRNSDSNEETKNDLKAPQPSTISSTPSIQKSSKETKKFEGTLVFKSHLKRSTGRSADVFFKGEIFNKGDYESIKAKLKPTIKDDGDEESLEEKIEVEISLQKTKDQIQKYLEELNKKIETGSKERINKKLTLAKFEEILKANQNYFESNLGKETYKTLLEKIKQLKGDKKEE